MFARSEISAFIDGFCQEFEEQWPSARIDQFFSMKLQTEPRLSNEEARREFLERLIQCDRDCFWTPSAGEPHHFATGWHVNDYPTFFGDRLTSESLYSAIFWDCYYRRRSGQCPMPGDYQKLVSMHQEPVSIDEKLVSIDQKLLDVMAKAELRLREENAFPEVPGYKILRELGSGGMGAVYLAWQLSNAGECTGDALALKLLNKFDPKRFETEVAALKKCNHPHIVKLLTSGEYSIGPDKSGKSDRAFLAMEFCDGWSLARRSGDSPVSRDWACRLIATLARAIHHAHEKGIIHRDLKPANIILLKDDSPKIVDFSVAKDTKATSGSTQSGAILGTPSYMAPEQEAGQPDAVGAWTDVYALGVILHELLTGERPLQATEKRKVKGGIEPGLEKICLDCLENEPTRRYQTALALAEDLERFLEGMPVRGSRAHVAGETASWVLGHARVGFAMLLAPVFVLLAGLMGRVTEGDSDPRPILVDPSETPKPRREKTKRNGPSSLKGKIPSKATAIRVPSDRGQAKAPEDGWTQLFNGRDLTGWQPVNSHATIWHVQDGTLIGTCDGPFGPSNAGLLVTNKAYGDFHLRVTAMPAEGPSSNVALRLDENLDGLSRGFWPKCYLVHIVGTKQGMTDPVEQRTAGTIRDATTRLIGKALPTELPSDWFVLEVVVRRGNQGDQLKGKINGSEVVSFASTSILDAGRIGLQCRPFGKVRFRKIEIKELNAPTLNGAMRRRVEGPPPFLGTHPGDERDDNSLGMKLCWCPAGTFTMGSPRREPFRRQDEGPVEVTMSQGYWMGKHTVTQREWQDVMGTSPSCFSPGGNGQNLLQGLDTSKFPVEQITWAEATEFCRKFTEQERKAARLPQGWTYRLPTEAQWEHACRAGTRTAFYFGDEQKDLGDYAWVKNNSGSRTHAVGRKRPNRWGLHDMCGNVWQWCKEPYQEQLPGGTDPEVPEGPGRRVARGGCWDYDGAFWCRSACRGGDIPRARRPILGFRLALVQLKTPSNVAVAEPAQVNEADTAEVLTPAQAANKVGAKVTVEFRAKWAGWSPGYDELYSERDWKNPACFFIRFSKAATPKRAEELQTKKMTSFVGKVVRATGVVRELRFASEGKRGAIDIDDWSQFKVLHEKELYTGFKDWTFSEGKSADTLFKDGFVLLKANAYMVSKKSNFTDVKTAFELAASRGTEAYLGVRMQRKDGSWHGITSRIFDNGTRISAGMQSTTLHAFEWGIGPKELRYDTFFSVRTSIQGAEHWVEVNGEQTSGVNYANIFGSESGSVGLILLKGSVKIRKPHVWAIP